MIIPHVYPFLAAVAAVAALSGCVGGTTYPVSPRIDLLGMPVVDQAEVQPVERTIPITPATRWVNVTSGETVHFIAGDQAFAWNFQVSPNVATFDLNQVAPPGVLARRIPVYVTPNPLYGSGG
jgi:hypothetical protein